MINVLFKRDVVADKWTPENESDQHGLKIRFCGESVQAEKGFDRGFCGRFYRVEGELVTYGGT